MKRLSTDNSQYGGFASALGLLHRPWPPGKGRHRRPRRTCRKGRRRTTGWLAGECGRWRTRRPHHRLCLDRRRQFRLAAQKRPLDHPRRHDPFPSETKLSPAAAFTGVFRSILLLPSAPLSPNPHGLELGGRAGEVPTITHIVFAGPLRGQRRAF